MKENLKELGSSQSHVSPTEPPDPPIRDTQAQDTCESSLPSHLSAVSSDSDSEGEDPYTGFSFDLLPPLIKAIKGNFKLGRASDGPCKTEEVLQAAEEGTCQLPLFH